VLARYIERGVFPRRTDDGFGDRRPRFIDDRGVHCAVGAMIAETGSPELARAIARDDEYAYVRDMRSPELAAWAESNGFTIDELATIQPSYTPAPTAGGERERLESARDDLTLACVREHAPLATVRLRVIGDRTGRVIATTPSNDSFARCIAATSGARGGGAYSPSPKPFRFEIVLHLSTPQEIFERRVAALTLESDGCAPRPGPLAQEVTIDISDGAVRAVTAPRNSEVERCFEHEVGARLGQLVLIGGVHAHKWSRLRSRLATGRAQIRATARHAIATCYDASAPASVKLSISATVDDAELAVGVDTTSEPFATCARDRIRDELRQAFTISRDDQGRSVPYFRIDADVSMSIVVDVVEADQAERARKSRPDSSRYE
jgi:hypothetical protein